MDEGTRASGWWAWMLILLAAAPACGGDDTSSGAVATTGSSAGGASSSGNGGEAGTAGSGTGGADAGSSAGSGGAAGAGGSARDSSIDSARESSNGVESDAPSDAQDVAAPCGRAKELCCPQAPACEPDAGVTLTCSVDFCLSCGDIPAYAPGCTNVARSGVVTAQREVPPDDAAIHANDGDVCTAWSSDDYANIRDSGVTGTFLQIDLQTIYRLDSMTFWMKSTPSDADVTLKFEYSTDGVSFVPWQAASGFTRLFHDNDPWVTPFQPPITARYFKVTFLDSPSYIAMRELALFTCPPADAGGD